MRKIQVFLNVRPVSRRASNTSKPSRWIAEWVARGTSVTMYTSSPRDAAEDARKLAHAWLAKRGNEHYLDTTHLYDKPAPAYAGSALEAQNVAARSAFVAAQNAQPVAEPVKHTGGIARNEKRLALYRRAIVLLESLDEKGIITPADTAMISNLISESREVENG